MPGALAFRHALHDAAVFQHDVMRGDIGAGGAELGDRAFHIRHAGVVQQDHVGQAALVAVAIVCRRDDVGSDRGIRGKSLHVRVGPGNGEGTLTLRINTSRRERTKGHEKTQTGQENGNTTSLKKIRVYYSFPLSSAQSGGRPLVRILPECVRRASPGSLRLKTAQIPPPIVNAFLTLSAVTKW